MNHSDIPVTVSVEQMRKSDEYTIQNFTDGKQLMYRAAYGIYKNFNWENKKIAIITGSGNNAGDGYALSVILKDNGITPTLICTSEKFSDDGRYYYNMAKSKSVPHIMFDSDTKLSDYDVVVDCLLGTGFSGIAKGVIKDAIFAINNSGCYVISADINSGLDGDTGQGKIAVKSDLTVSIGFYKQGMFKGDAPQITKKLVNVDIGIVPAPEG